MDAGILFRGWGPVGGTVLLGLLAYALLVVCLRGAGKRTLSKMNAFDFIVTVALGSMLATVLLSTQVTLARGAAGFGVLILLQMAIAWAASRSRAVRGLVKSTPRALVVDGRIDAAALRDERVAPDEVLSAIRRSGGGSLTAVAAVVLETDGSFSVIPRERAGDRSAFEGVRGL